MAAVLGRDRRLPHLRRRACRARCRRGRASRRRRTASSSTPPLATVAATIAMCSGTIWSSFWPKPRIASSGRFSVEVDDVAERAGRRRAGRSIGIVSPKPHVGDARRPCASGAELDGRSGRTGCCSCGRTPRPGRRRTRSRRSSRSGRWSAAARTRVSSGNDAVERRPRRSSRAMLGGDHLERRARHVALLVGVGEQRLAGIGLQEREHVAGRVEVGVGDQVGVVARVAPHRHDRAGASGRSRRPSPRGRRAASLATCWRSSRSVSCTMPDVVGVAAEQVGDGAQLLLGGRRR